MLWTPASAPLRKGAVLGSTNTRNHGCSRTCSRVGASASMLPLNALSIGAFHASAERSIIKPGLGYFEPWLRELSRAEPPAAPIDFRVAKAMGPTGYNSVRISVVSTDGPVDLSHLHPSSSYNDSFHFRWEGAFDMGVATTSCGAAVYNTSTLTWDADCLLKCTHDGACKHYTWFPTAHRCELSGATMYRRQSCLYKWAQTASVWAAMMWSCRCPHRVRGYEASSSQILVSRDAGLTASFRSRGTCTTEHI